jgi:hypothetical protein
MFQHPCTTGNYEICQKKIPQKVGGKNYREIAAAMSALSRKNVFADALSDL